MNNEKVHNEQRPCRGRSPFIVFIITRADDLGGAQVHVRDLASALVEQGEEVLVLAGGDGVLFEELKARNVPYRKLEELVHPLQPFRDWRAFKEIRAALQELKPALVTTHSNKAGLLGRLAARILNIPVIHTSHGFLFSGRKNTLAGRFYRLVEKIGALAASQVVAVSENEFQIARSLEVIPAHKMRVIHNGLPDMGEEYRADPLLEPPGLVMVARFEKPKDHETLFKALRGLKDRAWTLRLVGEGSGLQRVQRYAEQLKMSERISFLGMREDVPAILASAQIFVLSSRREGFPISILEAMRAGLPVVSAAVGGAAEAVEDNQTGLLFAPGEARELQGALARLLDEPILRQQMGRAGRRRFLEKFTIDQMVEKTKVLYGELTGYDDREYL